MTNIVVSGGVTSSGLFIDSTDTLTVLSGGFAIDTLNSGNIFVLGTLSNTQLQFGQVFISAGGVASATTAASNTAQTVSAGGSAVGTLLVGGSLNVFGTAIGTTELAGGMVVESGGLAIGTVASGAGLTISSGGVASGTQLSGFGGQVISAGGLARGTILGSNGIETISSGGVASGTIVGSQGFEQVVAGGSAISTTISSGGRIEFGSANVSGLILQSGAFVQLDSGPC